MTARAGQAGRIRWGSPTSGPFRVLGAGAGPSGAPESFGAATPMPRSPWTLTLLGAALLLLVLLQVTWVNLLPTAWAVPDLVAICVLAIALTHGARAGVVVGAVAGVVLDLIPPAAGPLGGWMLVLVLAAALMGRAGATYRPGPFAAMAVLALGSGAVVIARAVVVWFAGGATGMSWSALVLAVATSVAWGLLLAPAALLLSTRRTPRVASPPRVPPGLSSPARSGGRDRP